MKQMLYVKDVIVPLIAIPKSDESEFRFVGSGFYIGGNGHLVTCRHVIDALNEDEVLCAYQLGKRRELELAITTRSDKYDLALCKSSPPGINEPWPIVDRPFVGIGSDVEVYGYWHEPLGPDALPFRQRYMKGHIVGISRDPKYPDSFELNFPILFGMSGSPLLCHLPIEGEYKKQTGIVGCAYGFRESEVVRHMVTSSENYEERVSRIVELGLSYTPKAILSICEGSGTSINVFSEEDPCG